MMELDLIAEKAGWLDGIFTNPRNPGLFTDKTRAAIQKELADRWPHENRLALLKDTAAKYGEEPMLAVIDKIIWENGKEDWRQVGAEKGNSFENFMKILWEPLKDVGFEYSLEKQGNRTRFKVTKCPLFDLAKKLGAEKWMYHLLCLTDEPAITGFNSSIKFARSRTLMQGCPDCDHCYTDLS
jgi:predicted ArsR family transcriptional regulator